MTTCISWIDMEKNDGKLYLFEVPGGIHSGGPLGTEMIKTPWVDRAVQCLEDGKQVKAIMEIF